MAIYHLSVRIVKRSQGQSAVAVAARRSGERLFDRRLDLHVRPEGGGAPAVAEILLPKDAPAWLGAREELWNTAEATEKRLDAQLAREVELALPIELTNTEAIELAREFVQREFVTRGMVADLTIHLGGGHNPYANAMLTLREVTAQGFGRKVREWNQSGLLREWREQWAALANAYLARAGHAVRIDHGRKRDQAGQEMPAAVHLGKAAKAMQQRGLKHARLQRLEEQGGQPAKDRA